MTQNGDSGPGSLRQAIADSASGDIVAFSVTGSVTLTSVPLIIERDLVISGPGARTLNVTGSVAPIIYISGGNVAISGLKIGPGISGVFVVGGTLTATNCAVSGTTDGGAVYVGAGVALSMNGCTISGNTSSGQYGTGLRNDGTSSLSNCTISGNTCNHTVTPGGTSGGQGGGLFNTGGVLTLINCTVTGNTAANFAGGIAVNGSVTVQLANTIVANNTSPVGPDCVGAFVSNGYNLIGIKDGSTGLINNVNHDKVGTAASPLDPLLLPLQNNGGRTDTAAIFVSGSPAVNAGNNAAAPPRDQRGLIRPDTADIGACEFLGKQPVTLANISSRAVVQTGDNVVIGGFIVTGTQLKKVMLRAIGPSLSLPGKLSDPILDL